MSGAWAATSNFICLILRTFLPILLAVSYQDLYVNVSAIFYSIQLFVSLEYYVDLLSRAERV